MMTCKVCGYRISAEGERCPKCHGRIVDLDASQDAPECAQTLIMNLADAVALAGADASERQGGRPAPPSQTAVAAPKSETPGRIAGRPGSASPLPRTRRVMPDTVFGMRRLDVDVTKVKREAPKIVPAKDVEKPRFKVQPWHGILFFLLVGVPSIAYVIWIFTHAHG